MKYIIIEKITGLMDGAYSDQQKTIKYCESQKHDHPLGNWEVIPWDGKSIPENMEFGHIPPDDLNRRIEAQILLNQEINRK